MRTIGKRVPRSKRGENRGVCYECNAPDYVSRIPVRGDGNRYHDRCAPSMTAVELNRGNAEGARRRRAVEPR